jgi:hypothetical protein
MSKVTPGELIAGAGGVLLIISLFLDWVSGVTLPAANISVGGGNAFDVFSGMDIIMLIVGIAAIGLAGAAALEASGLPANAALGVSVLGLITFGWALGWDLEFSDAGIGAWLGLVAAAAIAYGGFQASQESVSTTPPPRTPAASTPPTSTAPPPAT